MSDGSPLCLIDGSAQVEVLVPPAQRRTVVVIAEADDSEPPGLLAGRQRRAACELAGMADAEVDPEEIWHQERGRGGVWAFHTPAQAHRFTRGFCSALAMHNQQLSPGSRKEIRVGIATSPIVELDLPTGFLVDGPAFLTAACMQESGQPGEVLADAETWQQLPEELQSVYTEEVVVTGKRQNWPGRRWTVRVELSR